MPPAKQLTSSQKFKDSVFCHSCKLWVAQIDKPSKEEEDVTLPHCPRCDKVLWEQMCIIHHNSFKYRLNQGAHHGEKD